MQGGCAAFAGDFHYTKSGEAVNRCIAGIRSDAFLQQADQIITFCFGWQVNKINQDCPAQVAKAEMTGGKPCRLFVNADNVTATAAVHINNGHRMGRIDHKASPIGQVQ